MDSIWEYLLYLIYTQKLESATTLTAEALEKKQKAVEERKKQVSHSLTLLYHDDNHVANALIITMGDSCYTGT